MTGGLAGEASVALATRLTVPLTIVLAAGLEKVRAGGVLSTRVVTSGRGRRIAGDVGRNDAQVVEAVGDERRVPGSGLAVEAAAVRRELVGDGRDAGAARVARVRRQRDGAADGIARAQHRGARRRVVDAAVGDDGGDASSFPAVSVATERKS